MTSPKFSIAIITSALLALNGCTLSPTPQLISEVNFVDPNFAQCVEETGATELAQVTELNCNGQQIRDVSEIRYMPALTDIVLLDNQINEIDVSHLKQLERLVVGGNQLTAIDVSNNQKLRSLNISGNKLTEIDVSDNPELISLYVYKTPLTSLDVSQQSKLRDLGVSRHQLSTIDLSNNPQLRMLNLSVGTLENIDLSHNPKLAFLYLPSNQLSQLDVSQNPDLKVLSVRNNQLPELMLGQNAKLEKIKADYNQIDHIEFNSQAPLRELELNNNRIAELDLAPFTQIDKLVAFNNPLRTLIFNVDYYPEMLSIEGTPVALANKPLDQQGIANLLSPRVSVIEGGTISQNGSQYNIVASQIVMPTIGQYIGFRYAVTLPKNAQGEVSPTLANQKQFPITVRMTHPTITDPKSGKGFTTSSWNDTMLAHDSNLALWYFGEKYELVEGRWTLEILYRDSVIAKRSFMLLNADDNSAKNQTNDPRFTMATLIKEGEGVLCAQDKYRSCLAFDNPKSCVSALKPYKEQCQQEALKAMEPHLRQTTQAQLKAFFSSYTACMAKNYIEHDSDLDVSQVGSCLLK